MAVISMKNKASRAALIAAMVAVALPGVASAAEAERGRGGWRGMGVESNDGDRGNRGQGQQRQEARQEARQEVRQQQAPVRSEDSRGYANRGGNGGGQPVVRSNEAPRWGSQRPADGQNYGRDRTTGEVSRPAPAWRGATPANPQAADARGTNWGGRDGNRDGRSYGDANRDGRSYTDRNRNGTYTGRATNDRNGSYRDGYRDGRTVDNYRDRRDTRESYRDGYRSGSRDGYRSGTSDYRRWDRNDWRRDNRYNWSGYRNQHRDIFRGGSYYSPYRNYSYRRLSIGFTLGSLFYGNRYWINDPWQYRLPDVYGPYRWVRYYDDVLLVDIYSGQVVDVIHDFFW